MHLILEYAPVVSKKQALQLGSQTLNMTLPVRPCCQCPIALTNETDFCLLFPQGFHAFQLVGDSGLQDIWIYEMCQRLGGIFYQLLSIRYAENKIMIINSS